MRIIEYARSIACVLIVATIVSCTQGDRRYPPLLQSGGTSVQPTPEQKLWALATCAVLTEANEGRHDLLGGCERTPDSIKNWRECLANWWGDSNREDLLQSLKWIEEGGHRRGFDKLARELSAVSHERLAIIRERAQKNPSISNQVELALRHKDEFGSKSIVAWDYDRYVALCGWGYIAGYISEEEAWQRIMPAARLLQQTFTSWEDLGLNHVVGREFWSFKHTVEFGTQTRLNYKKLLTDPTSPWVKLKWGMNLGPEVKSTSVNP